MMSSSASYLAIKAGGKAQLAEVSSSFCTYVSDDGADDVLSFGQIA
jgi:hypothetical protein